MALKIDANFTDSINGKAYTLAELGRYNEAVSVIKKADLSSFDNNEYLSSTMAFILYNLGKYEDAKQYYIKSLQINAN